MGRPGARVRPRRLAARPAVTLLTADAPVADRCHSLLRAGASPADQPPSPPNGLQEQCGTWRRPALLGVLVRFEDVSRTASGPGGPLCGVPPTAQAPGMRPAPVAHRLAPSGRLRGPVLPVGTGRLNSRHTVSEDHEPLAFPLVKRELTRLAGPATHALQEQRIVPPSVSPCDSGLVSCAGCRWNCPDDPRFASRGRGPPPRGGRT